MTGTGTSKINALLSWPLYVFLLPLFYVLHASNDYFGLFPFRFIGKYLAIYLLIAGLLFLLSRFFLKSIHKSGVWAITILLIFFFFGKIYDFLKEIHLPALFVSYTFLLSCIAIFIIALTIYCKRTVSDFTRFNTYFNLIFIIFVLVEIFSIAYHLISHTSRKNNLAINNPELKINLQPVNEYLKPDIFFIVFDEYTSSLSLKKFLHYDNTETDSALIQKGFYIADQSKSNYNSTPFSLSSAFNLQYFNIPLEHRLPTPDIMLKGEHAFSESLLPQLLRINEYQIKNFGLLDLQQNPAPNKNFFQREYESVFFHETMWNRIQKDIWWNIALKFPEQLVLKPYQKTALEIINLNKRNYNNVLKELQYQTDTAKFVYGHFFLPHRPYYINRNGQLNNTILNYYSYSRDSLYLEQIIFSNKWIDSLASVASKDYKRPRVVIIEGDHGYRDADDSQVIRDRELMNLSAYYFSDKNYNTLYKSISPVNSFRVIFNKYFNTQLPLLKDSSVLLY